MSLDAPVLPTIDATPFRVGVVAACFNSRWVDALLLQARHHLLASGVQPENLVVERVPGSGELPFAAQLLCARHPLDVCLALGVVIRGDTIHYQLVAEAAQQGLVRVGLDAKVPVICGLVVAGNVAEAEARCVGEIDRGAEFAGAALAMAALKRALTS
mgnify:CR=1 FL=1